MLFHKLKLIILKIMTKSITQYVILKQTYVTNCNMTAFCGFRTEKKAAAWKPEAAAIIMVSLVGWFILQEPCGA